MATNTRQFHEKFIGWASDNGGGSFERGVNVNGRDTYTDEAVQLAWRLWQDVADGVVIIEPDANVTGLAPGKDDK